MAQHTSNYMFSGPSHMDRVRWQSATVFSTSIIGPEQRDMENWVHLQSGWQQEPVSNITRMLNHFKGAHPALP